MNPRRIKQLDDATIGHIAAGEVVERPAQVIKELIENSLDAGATSITITVESGGFECMTVEDNGSGIEREDLPLALDRHATSKLSTKEDLASIASLGFRGEALASIGMVSKLTVSSQPAGAQGASVVMEDGVKSETVPEGMSDGTRISVEHLFANTPARLAFQRRPETETARIVDVVVNHALAHPECGFHLKSEARTLLNVPATGDMLDRLYDVMGAQATELVPLQQPPGDEEAPGQERWEGWISTPDITRGKGDDIHVLINRRPVAAGPFLQAIRRGYRTRLMQGRHPLAVLNLTCPPTEVDVNVHPTKREVRLRHSWRVLERLERAIAHTLEAVPTEPDATGGIPELQGFAARETTAKVESFFAPETGNEPPQGETSPNHGLALRPDLKPAKPGKGVPLLHPLPGPLQRENNSTSLGKKPRSWSATPQRARFRPRHWVKPFSRILKASPSHNICLLQNAIFTATRVQVRHNLQQWKLRSMGCSTTYQPWNLWPSLLTRTSWFRQRVNCSWLTSTPFTNASDTSGFATAGRPGSPKSDSHRFNLDWMPASRRWSMPNTSDSKPSVSIWNIKKENGYSMPHLNCLRARK